jgi:hypothetical protein
MANVFISHRVQDLAEAERLSREVEAAGHKVWLDEWEIGIGDSIVGEIQKGLQGSTYVVLCFSAAGVMSPWISREWMSTLARQLQGHPVKIRPVRLTGGEPPAILADLKYADLVADWTSGIASLLAAIK